MSVTFPAGFRAAAATAGIKPSGRPDLAIILRDGPDRPEAGAAMVFTTNAVVGAPVIVGRRLRDRLLAPGTGASLRALLVNAGNSNAATGQRGLDDAGACAAAAGAALKIDPASVLPSSTGVIGRLLPVDRIVAAVPALVAALGAGERADAAVAAAIMTTDSVPKVARREVVIQGRAVRLGAVAKGAGMIAPCLDSAASPPPPQATMLAFITTDAAVASPTLQRALELAVADSFNRISVDNHASCSDTVVVMASGLARPADSASATAAAPMLPITPGSLDYEAFVDALRGICTDLARQVVRDGEGATRLLRVEVSGAPTDAAAFRVAREVVNSPLVKCAIHGRDPNWGRIVTAAGNAGVPFNPDHASLSIGPVEVYARGVPIPAALVDPQLAAAMQAEEVLCRLTIGAGPGRSWMLGCDLTAKYVSINADYTT